MPDPIPENPLSQQAAKAVLLEHYGVGKPEVRTAVKQAPEKEVLADAMKNVTSGPEAYKLIDRGSRPKDHHQEIEDLTKTMGYTRDEKGKKIEPVAGSDEAKRQALVTNRLNLINEYQQNGFDGLNRGSQTYMVEQMRQMMLSDPNWAETFGKLSQAAQDKDITDKLRANHKIYAGKTETSLNEHFKNTEFTSTDYDKAFNDNQDAKRAITAAGEPGKNVQGEIRDKKKREITILLIIKPKRLITEVKIIQIERLSVIKNVR